MENFNEIIELLNQYKVTVCPDYLAGTIHSVEENQKINDLLGEINRRIIQLNYSLYEIDRIINLYNEASDELRKIGCLKGGKIINGLWTESDEQNYNKSWDNEKTLSIQLIYHLEAFYHQACRCQKCIIHLPKLGSFEKFRGVIKVRNKLIEHPSDNKFVATSFSFTFGGAEGPIYKSIRQDYENKEHLDEGFYLNRDEFILDLKKLLQSVISNN